MTQLILDSTTIKTDSEGRYCLNDLHKASGGEAIHAPAQFFRLDTTEALVNRLSKYAHLHIKPVESSRGRYGGTYVVKQLVYAYAMWISPDFHLKVIEFFDRGMTQGVAVADHAAEAVLKNPLSYFRKVLEQAEALQAERDRLAAEKQELEHDRDHVNIRQFEREVGVYFTQSQRNRISHHARKFCEEHGLSIQKEVMLVQSATYQGESTVNVYPVQALRHGYEKVFC